MIAAQKIEGSVGDSGEILETIMEGVTPSTETLPSEGKEEGHALDCAKNGLPDIILPQLDITVKDLALPGSLLVATNTATVLPDSQVYGSTKVATVNETATATLPLPTVGHHHVFAGLENLAFSDSGNLSFGAESPAGISTADSNNPPTQDDKVKDGKIGVIGFTDAVAPYGNEVEQAASPTASPRSDRSVISECEISASEYPHMRENAFAEFDYYDAEGSNGLNPHTLPVQDDGITVIGSVDAAPGNEKLRRQTLPKFEWGVGPAPGERGCVGGSPKKLGFLKKFFNKKKEPAIGHPPSLVITPKTKAKEQMDVTHAEGIVAKIIDIKKKLTGKSPDMATGNRL